MNSGIVGPMRTVLVALGLLAGMPVLALTGPHVHFEIYPSLASATSAVGKIRTSQLTFPLATLNEVYASSGYSASAANLASISYATDNVFSDGTTLQMAAISGSVSNGYSASLTFGISA